MIINPQRRALLLAAAVVLVSGCRPGGSAGPAPSTTAPTPHPVPDAPTTIPVPSAPADVEPPTAPPAPAIPSQEEIAARFSGRSPAYWGLEAPGILQTLADAAAGIALTVDFCGGHGGNQVDSAALAVLQSLQVPATLFLNARWIHANPALTRELAAVPFFELANHGSRHLPLSVTGNSAYGIPGTQNIAQVYEEIMTNDTLLTEITGKRPRFFRPGTAFLDEVATEIAYALGAIPAGFSINADGGATYSAEMVAAETVRARPGDIIISHGNHPGSGTAAGFAKAIPALLEKGFVFTTLSAAAP